ncbi:transcobalamin-1-like [Neolamprologus brichardi]|uniref:transcobalamin-1-like n=1 Tax=Neolamprologus brichardi TaxID=32507 RepID=UPI0016438A9B|nr:transcobalamin-1-like [Neolamprologus brichardi]
MTMMPSLLSAALLLSLLPWTLTEAPPMIPIAIMVKNTLQNKPLQTYKTEVISGGILLGAMKRLSDSDADFKFTYSDNDNYGPYLESVNGVAGNNEARTYWQLLANVTNSEFKPTEVGIGCIIPSPHQQIILNFTVW